MTRKITFLIEKSFFYSLLIFSFSFIAFQSYSQNLGVGINIAGNPANSKSLLDIDATGMNPKAGILIPRMTTAERNIISAPIPESLQIYNTDSHCFEAYYNGGWVSFGCLGGCQIPTQPSTITGSGTVCQSQSGVYFSVTNVSGVSYTWSYSGAGFTIGSGNGTNSISANFSTTATLGTLSVLGSNSCGSSTARTLAITMNFLPAAPTAGTNVPYATQIIWNWNTVSGATGYQWNTSSTYPGAGVNVVASPTYTQTGLASSTAFSLWVWAYNNCGNSTMTTLPQTTTCISYAGQACDNGGWQTLPGCDVNYGCASFWGVYYGDLPGDCNCANSQSCATQTGPTCTYIGFAYYDPFHYPQPPTGVCFNSTAAGYSGDHTFTKVIPTTGCTYQKYNSIPGTYQCDGSCLTNP